MNELSINIHIAGRVYPLTVHSNEEINLRAAGKLIQDKLQDYSKQFNLRDQQDALAMLAIEIANENLALKRQIAQSAQDTEKELDEINQLLKQVQL
ncbi:MAG: cell division protein ZapA [Bacteroidia bacterium]|nr:cell division protein ZapA [Bacteroidia bacterium]MCF8426894.1 cell division protein ZapA [Bacteroidia bacterium]